MRHLLRILFVVHALACCTLAQTSGQNVIQKKNASAGFSLESFTLGNSQLIGRTSGGTLSGLTLGSGLSLSGTTLSATGSSLTIGTTTITGGTSGHVLYNNAGTLGGLATSAGGNGDADSGKLALFNAEGGINMGTYSNISGNTMMTWRMGLGNVIAAGVDTFGQVIYAEVNGTGSDCFHAHITANATGENTGFDVDLTGGTGINYGYTALANPTHYALVLREKITGTEYDRFTIDAQGDHTWYKNGTTLTTGTDKTILTYATPSGTSTITIPATTGTLITTGDTGTVTNTMLAGSIALSKLSTTGTANSSTYLRGDGAWTAIDLSAYLTTATAASTYLPLAGGTLTGVTTFAAGSVSAPSITFTGATSNTGIYCTGTDTIDFAINGVRRVYIDSNGTLQTSGSGIQITNGNVISNSNYFSRGGAYYLGASDNCNISTGTGSPEGVVTAKVGSLYLRSDGGASTTLYVKESGTGNTGWVAK